MFPHGKFPMLQCSLAYLLRILVGAERLCIATFVHGDSIQGDSQPEVAREPSSLLLLLSSVLDHRRRNEIKIENLCIS